MKPARLSKYTNQTNAPVILEVAKAISAHLELSDVLGALVTTLKPMVEFDSIGVVVRDGDLCQTPLLVHRTCPTRRSRIRPEYPGACGIRTQHRTGGWPITKSADIGWFLSNAGFGYKNVKKTVVFAIK